MSIRLGAEGPTLMRGWLLCLLLILNISTCSDVDVHTSLNIILLSFEPRTDSSLPKRAFVWSIYAHVLLLPPKLTLCAPRQSNHYTSIILMVGLTFHDARLYSSMNDPMPSSSATTSTSTILQVVADAFTNSTDIEVSSYFDPASGHMGTTISIRDIPIQAKLEFPRPRKLLVRADGQGREDPTLWDCAMTAALNISLDKSHTSSPVAWGGKSTMTSWLDVLRDKELGVESSVVLIQENGYDWQGRWGSTVLGDIPDAGEVEIGVSLEISVGFWQGVSPLRRGLNMCEGSESDRVLKIIRELERAESALRDGKGEEVREDDRMVQIKSSEYGSPHLLGRVLPEAMRTLDQNGLLILRRSKQSEQGSSGKSERMLRSADSYLIAPPDRLEVPCWTRLTPSSQLEGCTTFWDIGCRLLIDRTVGPGDTGISRTASRKVSRAALRGVSRAASKKMYRAARRHKKVEEDDSIRFKLDKESVGCLQRCLWDIDDEPIDLESERFTLDGHTEEADKGILGSKTWAGFATLPSIDERGVEGVNHSVEIRLRATVYDETVSHGAVISRSG